MTIFKDKVAIVTGGASGIGRALGADLGVRVSVVCPGYIKTPIFETSKMINFDRRKVLEAHFRSDLG